MRPRLSHVHPLQSPFTHKGLNSAEGDGMLPAGCRAWPVASWHSGWPVQAPPGARCWGAAPLVPLSQASAQGPGAGALVEA